jgi:hypothetical protein
MQLWNGNEYSELLEGVNHELREKISVRKAFRITKPTHLVRWINNKVEKKITNVHS